MGDKITEYRIQAEPELLVYLNHLKANAGVAVEEAKKLPNRQAVYRRECIEWDRLHCSEVKQCVSQDGTILDLVILEGAAEPCERLKGAVSNFLQGLGYAYDNYLMIEVEWGEEG